MIFEVDVSMSVYVDVETGGAEAAKKLVRAHVANDWFLREREGAAAGIGSYVLKGEVGLVGEARPYRANRNVAMGQGEEEQIW